MPRTRERTPATSPLDPTRIYPAEALKRCGIGPSVLRDARASGMVRPITIGCRSMYLGRELCKWIESQSDGPTAQ